MEFDASSFMVGGVQLIALAFGLVQFIKEAFNLSGKKVTFLSAALGAVVFVLFQLIGILPEPYAQVVEILFSSVAFGLSASGYYKFFAARLPETTE